ncbi:hypothetical protein ACFL56_01265 [Candidatus Margulisiibacteriota bacterium]
MKKKKNTKINITEKFIEKFELMRNQCYGNFEGKGNQCSGTIINVYPSVYQLKDKNSNAHSIIVGAKIFLETLKKTEEKLGTNWFNISSN